MLVMTSNTPEQTTMTTKTKPKELFHQVNKSAWKDEEVEIDFISKMMAKNKEEDEKKEKELQEQAIKDQKKQENLKKYQSNGQVKPSETKTVPTQKTDVTPEVSLSDLQVQIH